MDEAVPISNIRNLEILNFYWRIILEFFCTEKSMRSRCKIHARYLSR